MSAEVGARLADAREAQAAWARRSARERCRIVGKVRGGLVDRVDGLADRLVEVVEGRASRVEALTGEVLPLLSAAAWLGKRGAGVLRARRVGWRGRPMWLAGHSAVVERRALGVVLVVAPGNYPLMLAGVQALQALAAGNAVAVKPAPGTGDVMAALGEALQEAGLPRGLFVVLDDAAEAGREAMAAGVDHVVFTGSAATGRVILGELADRLTPATMELSGCDACYVLPSASEADLDRAAKALCFGLTYNGSQTCIAPRRVMATARHAEALWERVVAGLEADGVAGVRVGEAVARRFRELMDGAVADGARVVVGGEVGEGGVVRPTVLREVSATSALVMSDVFAPWLAFIECADEGAMLAADARCPYRLGASIFGPAAEARALAARVGASNIAINDVIVPTADPRLPFGASGESGYGVTRGPEGLLSMTRPVVVSTRRGGVPRHYDTKTPGLDRVLRAAIRVGHGRGLAARLGATGELVRAIAGLGRDNGSPGDGPSPRA